MTEEIIEFPVDSRQWLLQTFYSAVLFLVVMKLAGAAMAVIVVSILNAFMLAGPVTALLDARRKTLRYVYRKTYSFRSQPDIDLSNYSRIYTQIESYASRSLYLSGPRGEHIKLAKFNQSPISPNQHIKEVTALRENIAKALRIYDGGNV